MANALKGEAQIVIDGKTYTLVMDQNALCSAEEMSGKDLDQLLDGLQRGRSLSVRRVMFWAGLQARHPGIHLVQAGELMSLATANEVHEAVSKAVIGAFPPPKEEGQADPIELAA